MNVDEERELRRRLGAALEAITPSPAPVGTTLRKGKIMKTRRRIGIVAALAAAAGIAVATPSLAHQLARPAPAAPARPSITVSPRGLHPPRGLIDQGAVNGKPWQVALVPAPLTSANEDCVFLEIGGVSTGAGPCLAGGRQPMTGEDFGGLVNIESAQPVPGQGVTYYWGAAQPDVTRVVVALTDGTQLTLDTAPVDGHLYVGFPVPSGLGIAKVTVYSARSELGFGVPFPVPSDMPTIPTWLSPGEQAPRPASYVIGSGVVHGVRWSDVLRAGSWGYCFQVHPYDATLPGYLSPCEPDMSALGWPYEGGEALPEAPASAGAVPENIEWIAQGGAPASVAYVIGTLSDGRMIRARTVDVGGHEFWALALPGTVQLRRVACFSATGRQIAVAPGNRAF